MPKCSTPYCRNDALKYRDKCSKCRSREFAKKHPFKYYYNKLKCSARRRGKEFDLTLAEFKALWMEHPEKWEEKKRFNHECKWQMDRIDNRKGYTYDNIQIISKRKNIMKYVKEDRFHMDVKWSKQPELDLKPDEEAPF